MNVQRKSIFVQGLRSMLVQRSLEVVFKKGGDLQTKYGTLIRKREGSNVRDVINPACWLSSCYWRRQTVHAASLPLYRRAQITSRENMQPNPHGEYSILAILSQAIVGSAVASFAISPASPTQSYNRLRLCRSPI